MEITGAHFIGNSRSKEGTNLFQSLSPSDNSVNGNTEFADATKREINEAVALAKQASEPYRQSSKEERGEFLEAIASNIEELGEQLIHECMAETALPEARLIGERGRTANQLRLFAQVVRDGTWVDARIDTANPNRTPLPKPDVRSMSKPLGPVAVFGASNFPLAFSVAGGDTASALAAGCPVVFKAHPAHPRACELVAYAITKAAQQTNMPSGVFSLIQGRSNDVGRTLVKHPDVTAVAFTGSQKGGLALFQLANARPQPVPVYAEMGSTNPIFILPEALATQWEKIAAGLAGSVNLGVGQFCTNPGLVFTSKQTDPAPFVQKLASTISEHHGGTMLTAGIADSYRSGAASLRDVDGVDEKAVGHSSGEINDVNSYLFQTDASTFLESGQLKEELFGPSTVFVTADSRNQLLEAANTMEGQLTATIYGTEAELEDYRDLVSILEEKAGRLIINGYPTGVEVCHAMVHGGPFPATTAPSTTSVGTAAIKRFVRPVAYQDFPQGLLPEALRDENPWGIFRLVNGEMTKDPID